MELIELDATAQRALELLTNAGMSDGSIYDYFCSCTGIGQLRNTDAEGTPMVRANGWLQPDNNSRRSAKRCSGSFRIPVSRTMLTCKILLFPSNVNT